MSTMQMLMVIGALMLFSFIALSVNDLVSEQNLVMLGSQSGIGAVSLAWGQIDDLVNAGFDTLPVGTVTVDSVSTAFDVFVCSTSVDYVSSSNLDSTVIGPTSLKRVNVTVSNGYPLGSVTLSKVIGNY